MCFDGAFCCLLVRCCGRGGVAQMRGAVPINKREGVQGEGAEPPPAGRSMLMWSRSSGRGAG